MRPCAFTEEVKRTGPHVRLDNNYRVVLVWVSRVGVSVDHRITMLSDGPGSVPALNFGILRDGLESGLKGVCGFYFFLLLFWISVIVSVVEVGFIMHELVALENIASVVAPVLRLAHVLGSRHRDVVVIVAVFLEVSAVFL